MGFTPDMTEALGAAVDLVNALYDGRMASVSRLQHFYDKWGYTGARPRTQADLAAVQELSPQLRALLTSDRDSTVALINRILAEQQALPQLVRHDHLDWHIHAISEDRPMHERILVETAMALVDLIRADEMSRLQICEARDCQGVVFDLSRNRSRRYCSIQCSNREAQAAHRARRLG